MTEPETAVPVRRDGLAVASLITGVLGFFGITAVLGVGFGIAALVRIHRTGERGRGLAVGGIAAGVVWAIALPVATVLVLAGLANGSNAPIAALQIHHCYNLASPGQDAVEAPCQGEYDGVVLDTFTMAGLQTPYPGDRAAADGVLRSCRSRLDGMYGGSGTDWIPPGLKLAAFAPDERAWTAGERIGTCGLQTGGGRLSGPLFP
ncbi:DUF4190 domain-containing protein [Amycolatopsis sp. H6(2020)]|nr:DUF4190 domain-containing protein [Amycolatopsis sp. H6(2020)]